jgi:hypothetical protein
MKTKTEYVKVEFANDKELAKAYSEMDLYVENPRCKADFIKVRFGDLEGIIYHNADIYKKIEVDVKQELKKYINQCQQITGISDFNMFSFNQFKEESEVIRWHEEFIGACHLIAELTDDPRSEL